MNAPLPTIHPTRRKRVALYSADSQLRRDVATRLEALAIYDVRIAEAAAFLQGPAADDARPSIVILDVGDGDLLNGSQVVEARAKWGATPLIALSGELQPNQMRNLVRLNAADWLRKPLDGKELLNAVTFHDSGSQATKSRDHHLHRRQRRRRRHDDGTFGGRISRRQIGRTSGRDLPRRSRFPERQLQSYLNLYSEFDMDGIVSHPDRLDVELMDIIKLTHKPGFTHLFLRAARAAV